MIVSNKFVKFWGKLIGSPRLKGISILLWIIVVENVPDYIINHEKIHRRDRIELAILGSMILLLLFLLGINVHILIAIKLILMYEVLYMIEYIIRRIFRGARNANKKTVFEKHAYANQNNLTYLKNKKLFSWFKYYFKI